MEKHLLEQGPSELDAHVLVTLHVEEVEGLLAAQRPGSPGETLAVPHGELQLHMDPRSFLPPVNPVGAQPMVGVSACLHWAVLVHVEGRPIQYLLHLTPLREENPSQAPSHHLLPKLWFSRAVDGEAGVRAPGLHAACLFPPCCSLPTPGPEDSQLNV